MIALYLVCILVGVFLIIAALRNSDWIRAFAEFDLIDHILGETTARVACGVTGCALIVTMIVIWVK